MMMGGGGNAHCKMYVDWRRACAARPATSQIMRKAPYSMDRYQQFMPIWNELRAR